MDQRPFSHPIPKNRGRAVGISAPVERWAFFEDEVKKRPLIHPSVPMKEQIDA
jgi:hypothetical protein